MHHLFLFLLILTGSALRAQELTPAQKAELQEAGQLLKQYQDPVFMGKLLDEQIREAKKNGATPAQIRELEQAKIETINQLKADLAEADRQKNQPASPPEKDEPDPNETMLAAFKKRVSQPDTIPASLIYDEEPGRYSDLPASFRFYTESKLSASEFPAFMLKKFGVTLRETGRFGTREAPVIRYEQRYRDHAIRLSQYSISLDSSGYVQRASGTLFLPTQTPGTPRPPVDLLPQLRQATGLPALRLQTSPVSETMALPLAEPLPLIWVHADLNPASALKLAQPFTVRSATGIVRWYLDAQTGAVAASENRIRTCAPPPVPNSKIRLVNTFHHGKKPVGVQKGGTQQKPQFTLFDDTESPTVLILSPELGSRLLQWTTDTTLNDAKLRARGDFDALYGFRQSARFFKRFGFNSYDNAGTAVEAKSYNEANACWSPDESQFYFGMMIKKPLANLAIIGHEFTHAVIEHTADLIYRGESGALNESIADMMGTTIEHQTIGGDWVLNEAFEPGGFRNMANPTAKGDPDTYLEAPWRSTSSPADNGGVHHNSGIGNKWFYLLIKGGKGTNGLKHPYDVFPTISYNNAVKLVLATLPKLSPADGYEVFCQQTIATAEQLYGECSPQTEAVKRAWYAVGVLDDPPASCKPGWTMEVVLKSGSEKVRSMLYIKGDSLVSVYKDPESIVKTFSRRSSAYMTWVVQDADGLTASTLPKDYMNLYYQKTEELIPVQEAMMAEQLRQVRATINNPAANAEDRAQARESETMLMNGQREMTKAQAQLKADQAELAQPVKAVSEAAFWRNQGGKRKFDKDYIKATTKYEGKYLTRKYVLSEAMIWWSTSEIPLRLSDVVQLLPTASVAAMRSGIDYLMRGFPVNYLNMMQMQNIREAAPANFDMLFSTAAVWD